MKGYFSIVPIMEGVTHIGDQMHVYATLITGSREAILFDTTNGIGNLREQVESLTALPYRVIASHGHGDHTRGNYQFDRVWLHPDDFAICREWNGNEARADSLRSAQRTGLVPEDFDTDAFVRGGPRPAGGAGPQGGIRLRRTDGSGGAHAGPYAGLCGPAASGAAPAAYLGRLQSHDVDVPEGGLEHPSLGPDAGAG